MSSVRAEWANRPERSPRFWLHLVRTLALRLGRAPTRLLLHPITLYFLLAERGRHLFCFVSALYDRLFLLNDRAALFDIDIKGRELTDYVARLESQCRAV